MSNISSAQFIPQEDDGHAAAQHVPHATAPYRASRDDWASAMDTKMDTGEQRQPWAGTGRLAAPQKGALTSRERSLSLVGASGEAYGTPAPIQEGSFGSYAFKMG